MLKNLLLTIIVGLVAVSPLVSADQPGDMRIVFTESFIEFLEANTCILEDLEEDITGKSGKKIFIKDFSIQGVIKPITKKIAIEKWLINKYSNIDSISMMLKCSEYANEFVLLQNKINTFLLNNHKPLSRGNFSIKSFLGNKFKALAADEINYGVIQTKEARDLWSKIKKDHEVYNAITTSVDSVIFKLRHESKPVDVNRYVDTSGILVHWVPSEVKMSTNDFLVVTAKRIAGIRFELFGKDLNTRSVNKAQWFIQATQEEEWIMGMLVDTILDYVNSNLEYKTKSDWNGNNLSVDAEKIITIFEKKIHFKD